MKKKLFKKASGFTLIEILLVVAAIAVLAGIVIVAINPAKTLAEMRNADRVSDINQIHKAVYQHTINNRGGLHSSILALDADTPEDICKNGGDEDCFDLETLLVPTYLAEIPEDPNVSGDDDLSGYQIVRTSGNRIIVQASSDYVELSQVLAVGGDFVEGDTEAPTLSSSTPADNATDVAVDADIVLTMSETVVAGTGNISIYETTGDVLVENIAITSGMISDDTVTIDPSSDLDNDTEYYVLIASTVLDDAEGNSYAGISDSTALSFTTESGGPVIAFSIVADYNSDSNFTSYVGDYYASGNIGTQSWCDGDIIYTNGTRFASGWYLYEDLNQAQLCGSANYGSTSDEFYTPSPWAGDVGDIYSSSLGDYVGRWRVD